MRDLALEQCVDEQLHCVSVKLRWSHGGPHTHSQKSHCGEVPGNDDRRCVCNPHTNKLQKLGTDQMNLYLSLKPLNIYVVNRCLMNENNIAWDDCGGHTLFHRDGTLFMTDYWFENSLRKVWQNRRCKPMECLGEYESITASPSLHALFSFFQCYLSSPLCCVVGGASGWAALNLCPWSPHFTSSLLPVVVQPEERLHETFKVNNSPVFSNLRFF